MNLALVIGCARSGTSILGELIAAHPQVKYIFEAHDVWESAGAGENDSHRLSAAHATPQVRQYIRHWFQQQQQGARLIAEKSPRNILRIPFLQEVFPEAKIIHIIRDGRDVACSLLPGIGGSEWRHLKPPSWRTLFTQQRGIVRCALAWKKIMEIALHDLAAVPHLRVRYEQLVAHPQKVARTLIRYLNLPEDPAVIRFCNKIQNATTESYHARSQRQWYRPDHQWRVGRWRENIPKDQQQVINDLVLPMLRALNNQTLRGQEYCPRERTNTNVVAEAGRDPYTPQLNKKRVQKPYESGCPPQLRGD